jgi:tetratricopeptide (TPR) repeat protein
MDKSYHTAVIIFFAVILFCFGFFLDSYAERIVLKTGDVIEGRMLDMGADFITLEVFGVPKTYSLDQVKSIDGKAFDLPPRIAIDNLRVNARDAQDNKIFQKPQEPAVSVSSLSSELKQQPPEPTQPQKAKNLSNAKKEKIEKLKEKFSDEALSYFEIGYIHSSLGEDVKASENYRKALKVDSYLGQKFFNQGLDEFYLERHVAARDKFLRARELFEVQEDSRMVRLVNQQIRELYNNPNEDIF